MSALKRERQSDGIYPNLRVCDIVHDGYVQVYRNPAGKVFKREDVTCLDYKWGNFSQLRTAIRHAKAAMAKQDEKEPSAWDPEFGFLSVNPSYAGNNFFINCFVHLEALNLLGDLKYVLGALKAVRIETWGFQAEAIHDAAHIYRIENRYSLGIALDTLIERVTRVFHDLVMQEINARIHLVEEDPRIFADALSRALAILRSARLLSPWELTDILSPIRMAASMGFIDGIEKFEIDEFILNQFDEAPPEEVLSREQERDRTRSDAKFADKVNKRFARVHVSELGRRIFES